LVDLVGDWEAAVDPGRSVENCSERRNEMLILTLQLLSATAVKLRLTACGHLESASTPDQLRQVLEWLWNNKSDEPLDETHMERLLQRRQHKFSYTSIALASDVVLAPSSSLVLSFTLENAHIFALSFSVKPYPQFDTVDLSVELTETVSQGSLKTRLQAQGSVKRKLLRINTDSEINANSWEVQILNLARRPVILDNIDVVPISGLRI
jgi:hypothetical protein